MAESDEQTQFQKDLLEALSDDLNISKALSLIDEMIATANETLDTAGKHKELKRHTMANLAYIEKVLGFGVKNPFEYFQFGIDANTKAKIDALIEERNTAKKEKNFELSDKLRDQILAYGVQLMDTPAGTFWEKV